MTGNARVDVWLLRAFFDQDGYRATKIANQVERYFMQAEGPAYLEEDPRWREKWARAQEGDARWARFFEDLYWLPRRR